MFWPAFILLGDPQKVVPLFFCNESNERRIWISGSAHALSDKISKDIRISVNIILSSILCSYDPPAPPAAALFSPGLGNDDFSKLPFCFPIPNRFNTSRTSTGPDGGPRRDRVRDRGSMSLLSVPMDEAWSSVESDGGFTSAGLDMLLRPSSASRKSVTPIPRVGRVKLCSETFSMCIKAGEIFKSGEMPSPRMVESNVAGRSTAVSM
jgi:hypothetical protein